MAKVYIKYNSDFYITEVNSDIFLSDTSDYTLIDEGTGDKYCHAQNHYFDKPIFDKGKYNYKYLNGEVVDAV